MRATGFTVGWLFFAARLVPAPWKVPGARVVDPVHLDRGRIVVDRDVHRPAECALDALAGTASAAEKIHD